MQGIQIMIDHFKIYQLNLLDLSPIHFHIFPSLFFLFLLLKLKYCDFQPFMRVHEHFILFLYFLTAVFPFIEVREFIHFMIAIQLFQVLLIICAINVTKEARMFEWNTTPLISV